MTIPFNRICVFAGSSIGRRSEYAEAATLLGRGLAEQGLTLVYGGGHVGLMGELADAALAAGGEVIGVIPQALHLREIVHTGLTSLHVVSSMHERKAMMTSLADAFVVLPGGLGTVEETLEVWTWGQLGLHCKPIGLLNVGGFWQPMIEMLERMVAEGFVDARDRQIACVDERVDGLLAVLRAWQPDPKPRLLSPDQI